MKKRGGQRKFDFSIKYNRLTPIEFAAPDHKGRTMIKCLCDCGNIKIANSYSLKIGDTKSCGCLKKEVDNSRIGEKHPRWNVHSSDKERVCKYCKILLPLNKFKKINRNSRIYFSHKCSSCLYKRIVDIKNSYSDDKKLAYKKRRKIEKTKYYYSIGGKIARLKYRENNKEKISAREHLYYLNNKEKISSRKKKWNALNKEWFRIYFKKKKKKDMRIH